MSYFNGRNSPEGLLKVTGSQDSGILNKW